MRRLWLLGTLLLLAACAGEQDPVPRADGSEARPAETVAVQAGDQRRTVQLPDGTERSFMLHVRPAFEAGDPLPLVVVLHGAPGSAREMERVTGFDAVADDEGFLVAYPDAFDAADQVAALVDHLEAVTPVDP